MLNTITITKKGLINVLKIFSNNHIVKLGGSKPIKQISIIRLEDNIMDDTAGLLVDLSHHNTSVDFAAIKAGGIVAVILKATQGTRFTDWTFASRVAAAKSEGLLVGAYHYFDPDIDPIAQANYLLGVAGAEGVDVLSLDFEPDKAGDGEVNAATFCQHIYDKTGRWPLLYTGKWKIKPANAIFSKCPLWIAEWATIETPNLPPGFSTWEFWQFESALNTVSGVAGDCSRSRVNGTLADLKKWWSSTTPPSETVLETIVDASGKTHQLVDRIVSAASSTISGTAVIAFLILSLLGSAKNLSTAQAQAVVEQRPAIVRQSHIYGLDWRIGSKEVECYQNASWNPCHQW